MLRIGRNVAGVLGGPMGSTHFDSCRADTSIFIIWGSITGMCLSAEKEEDENRGRRRAHDSGERPATGTITTSSRSNGAGSVQVIFAPGPPRLSMAIGLTKLL